MGAGFSLVPCLPHLLVKMSSRWALPHAGTAGEESLSCRSHDDQPGEQVFVCSEDYQRTFEPFPDWCTAGEEFQPSCFPPLLSPPLSSSPPCRIDLLSWRSISSSRLFWVTSPAQAHQRPPVLHLLPFSSVGCDFGLALIYLAD